MGRLQGDHAALRSNTFLLPPKVIQKNQTKPNIAIERPKDALFTQTANIVHNFLAVSV